MRATSEEQVLVRFAKIHHAAEDAPRGRAPPGVRDGKAVRRSRPCLRGFGARALIGRVRGWGGLSPLEAEFAVLLLLGGGFGLPLGATFGHPLAGLSLGLAIGASAGAWLLRVAP